MIFISGCLCVHNNIAYHGAGAGIFRVTNFELPSDSSWWGVKNQCTVSCRDSCIDFSGNKATKGGSDAYGLQLFDCNVGDQQHIPIPIARVKTENSFYGSPLVKNFHFNNTDLLSSMSTDPVMVCFCNTSSHLPQCSERTHHTSTYPGMEINTMIATLGYYGGTSPGTVLVNVDNATLVHYYGGKMTVKCFTIHILLANPTPNISTG